MTFSTLILGTVQFGMNYGIANTAGKPSFTSVCEMISDAWEYGVNCLDTAAAYGESEEVVGKALRELQLHGHMQIVSKVGHFSEALSGIELKQYIQKSVETSLQRLQVDYLDVCLFHHEKYFYAIEALAELKERGLIKAAGISFSGLSFEDAAKVLLSPHVEVVQVPGSILDRRFGERGYQLARQQSIPVFVRSTYLQGLLLMETAPAHLREMQPSLDQLAKIARENDLTREALCVRYMLGVNGVSSLLMGVDNRDQLRENVRLIEQGPLPVELHGQIADVLPLLSAQLLCPALWPKL